MNPSSQQTVLVTGAAGFIGKAAIHELLREGWRIRALVRRDPPPGFPQHEQIDICRGDIRDSTALERAVQGAVAVVHLAAAKSDEPDSDDVNIGSARRLVSVCQQVGCRRIINISTQSAKITRQGLYARSKAQADRVFHESGLAVTTLRPSIVYGEEQSGVFATLLKFIEKLPVVPILGDGRWISAPVHVRDVATAITACLRHDTTAGRIYDLGGPDQISFDELIDRIGRAVGRRRPTIHIPFSVALLAARVVIKLLPHPPITISNVLGSNQNTDINIEPACRDFGFAPLNLTDGLALVFPATAFAELREEGRHLAHYLLGIEPSPALLDRYVAACRHLWDPAMDEPEVRWWRRHFHLIPVLDAAAGLLRPQSLLRRKVLLMAAILETTPEQAEFYLQRPPRKPWVFIVLAGHGVWAAAKAFVGLPVLWWARRTG